MKLDQPNGTITEKYEIEPIGRFAISEIEEIRNGSIPATDVLHIEQFESGEYKKTPLIGIRVTLRRPLTALTTEDLGLFRSKFTFAPQRLTLMTHDVSERRVGPESIPAEGYPYRLGTGDETVSNVDLQLPKNSFLASSPKGEFNPLPDKDALKLSLSAASQNIEVYYLRRGRFSAVRGFLAQSSNHDVMVVVLGVLFWPVAAVILGVFHKKLADRILQGLARLFRRKAHRQIGFRGSDSKKD